MGAFWIAISMTKEIKRILHLVNDKAQAKKNQTNELMQLLSEYVDTHGISLQLTTNFSFVEFFLLFFYIFRLEHDFSDILQPIFMSLFTWSLFAISGALLMIQVEIVK